MERDKLSNKSIITIAFIGFIFLVALYFVIASIQQKRSKYEYYLNSGWNIYVNGEKLYDQNGDTAISDTNFGSMKAGTQLDIERTLTEELNGGYTVEILVYLCSVEAYVDDELIYSYGNDLIGKNTMVGSGCHFINLPDDVAGKKLRLHMVINENDAYTSIVTPKCAKSDEIGVAFARTQMINCMVGSFLIILGVILTIVSILASFYDRVFVRLIFIGLFSCFIGSWTILSNKVSQIFSLDRLTNTNMEYLSLYLAPVPFAYLMYIMKKDDTTWRKKVIQCVCVILTIFAVLSIALHNLNIARYPQILKVFHVIGMISIFAMVVAGYGSSKKKADAENVTSMAMIILMGILAIDLIRFNIQKYVLPNNTALMNSFIPIGALTFVIMLLVSYLLYLYDMVMTKTEKEVLLRLAYQDVLTGLGNRAKYEEKMAELNSASEDFAIISMDVNGLKEVNDNYGHNSGDLLLTTFASVIDNVFGEMGVCYRTGGDEFVIVIDEKHIGEIPSAFVEFQMQENDASKGLDFIVEASYGVAYRSEKVDDVFEIFKYADRRMYEMKTELKGKLYKFSRR